MPEKPYPTYHALLPYGIPFLGLKTPGQCGEENLCCGAPAVPGLPALSTAHPAPTSTNLHSATLQLQCSQEMWVPCTSQFPMSILVPAKKKPSEMQNPVKTRNVNLLNFREELYFLVSALALRVSYYHCTVFSLMVTTSRKLFSVPLPLLK